MYVVLLTFVTHDADLPALLVLVEDLGGVFAAVVVHDVLVVAEQVVAHEVAVRPAADGAEQRDGVVLDAARARVVLQREKNREQVSLSCWLRSFR